LHAFEVRRQELQRFAGFRVQARLAGRLVAERAQFQLGVGAFGQKLRGSVHETLLSGGW
jgi:hypothetical protein